MKDSFCCEDAQKRQWLELTEVGSHIKQAQQQAAAGGHGTGVYLPSHGAVGDPLPGGGAFPLGAMPSAGLPPAGPPHPGCGASQRSDDAHSMRTESPPSGEQAQQQPTVRLLNTGLLSDAGYASLTCAPATCPNVRRMTVHAWPVRRRLRCSLSYQRCLI